MWGEGSGFGCWQAPSLQWGGLLWRGGGMPMAPRAAHESCAPFMASPSTHAIHCPCPLCSPQLWNFATASRLFEFEGWGCAVRCIAPSPALDVVGVGLEDG